MFFSFSSSAKGQTTQTTPLIEARQEKTRVFQPQLLYYFSKSDNKSNHHQEKNERKRGGGKKKKKRKREGDEFRVVEQRGY